MSVYRSRVGGLDENIILFGILITMNTEKSKEREKYEQVILYFINNISKNAIGKTKLVKLLYYFDFIHYRDHGKSVTGAHYYKQQFGPLPKDFPAVISDLANDDRIKVTHEEYQYGGWERYEALQQPNLSVFTEDEKVLMEKIVEKYKNVKREDIVRKSHAESPWLYAKYGGLLDYELSSDIIDFDEEAEEELRIEDEAINEAANSIADE